MKKVGTYPAFFASDKIVKVTNLSKTVRKKRNLRRLSAAWLFLLAVELFCPALCNDSAYADETASSLPVTFLSVSNESKIKSGNAFAYSQDQSNDNHQNVCNDECLCHATAIPGIDIITFKTIRASGERIAFQYGEPLFNSLPPPFQPPKQS